MKADSTTDSTHGARQVEVVRTYLQMTSRDRFKPAFLTGESVRVEEVVDCPPSFFRYLYREVGRSYHWIDRLGWTDDEISAHLSQPGLSLWVMYSAGAPAGYFELFKHDDGSVEIAYFGLLEEFIGKGLGKHLLSVAVEEAWNLAPARVWLHTCSLDGEAAMPNYLRRGFTPYKDETYVTEVGPEEELERLK